MVAELSGVHLAAPIVSQNTALIESEDQRRSLPVSDIGPRSGNIYLDCRNVIGDADRGAPCYCTSTASAAVKTRKPDNGAVAGKTVPMVVGLGR